MFLVCGNQWSFSCITLKCCLQKVNAKSPGVQRTLCQRLSPGFHITNFHFGCHFVFVNQWRPFGFKLNWCCWSAPCLLLPALHRLHDCQYFVVLIAVVLSPLKMAYLPFLLPLSDAPHGTSLFILLSLPILSPLHKTVGRNKGRAFSFSFCDLLELYNHALNVLIRCGHKLVCVFGERELCVPANKHVVAKKWVSGGAGKKDGNYASESVLKMRSWGWHLWLIWFMIHSFSDCEC